MYPRDPQRSFRRRFDPAPDVRPDPGDRLAAVLIPVIEPQGEPPSLVLTRRSEGLSRHAGEISFPGGLVDPEDADPAAAALREADEELGIDPASVEVLGAIAPVHTSVSGILVVPFVGVLTNRPVWRPAPGEIAEVLEVTIAELLALEAGVELDLPGGRRWRGWAYDLPAGRIWGATGVMLHAFLDHVRGDGGGVSGEPAGE